jgi:hypothetical protein
VEHAVPEDPGFAPPEPAPVSQRYVPPPPDASPTVYTYGPKKSPRWVAPVVVGAAILIVGAIVAGAITVINALPDVISSGNELFGPNPLESGSPQSPVATVPLECESQCFTEDVVAETIVPQSRLDELGLTTITEEWGDYEPTDAAWEYPYLTSEWQRRGSETDDCFFTLPQFPLAAELGTPPAGGDFVDFTGMSSSEDEFSYFTQSVRIFPTSAEAVDHMSRLDDYVTTCDYYTYDPEVEDWKATVSPAPALAVPDSVAAVGWREANAIGRYYVFDLQYANLVVRTAIATPDVISEAQYRAVVEELAGHLAQLELPQGLV